MRYLKLFEEYNKKPLYQAKNLLNNIKQNVKSWFTEGSLSKQGLELQDADESFTDDVADKTFIFRFSDENYLYQVIIVIGIEDLFKDEEGAQMQMQGEPTQEEGEDEFGLQEESLQINEDKKIENIDIKIKKYNLDGTGDNNYDGPLVDFWEGQISVQEFTEDFIIEKISQMEDENLSTTNTALNQDTQEETGIQELF